MNCLLDMCEFDERGWPERRKTRQSVSKLTDVNLVDICPADLNSELERTVAIVERSGLLGVADFDGNFLIEPRFLELGSFRDNLAWAAIDLGNRRRFGFVDLQGNWVIEPVYDKASEFNNGLAGVEVYENGVTRYGCIDPTGTAVIPLEFGSFVSFHGELAAVRRDGKSGFINRRGEMIVPFRYDEAFCRTDSTIYFVEMEGDLGFLYPKYGIADLKGNVLFPCTIEEIHPNEEGYAIIEMGNSTAAISPEAEYIWGPKYVLTAHWVLKVSPRWHYVFVVTLIAIGLALVTWILLVLRRSTKIPS